MKRAITSDNIIRPLANCGCNSVAINGGYDYCHPVCLKCRTPYTVNYICDNCGYIFQKNGSCLNCGLQNTFRKYGI